MKKIKNATQTEQTWVGQIFPADYVHPIPPIEEDDWANESILITAIANGQAIVLSDNDELIDVNTAIKFLQNKLPIESVVTETPPFAKPDYRTKNDAISVPITIVPNSTGNADFLLTEERYVSGGEMIIENAMFGDYVTAEVCDIGNVIPVPYRAALCENHPTVSKYVIKRYVMPANSEGYSFCELDTRPLTAKITAGLYLRITYNTIASGLDRRFVVNYNLTKKL